MKNKNFFYLLILAVSVVWGIIFYRIFLTLPSRPEPFVQTSRPVGGTDYRPAVSYDTVSLDLNYRDPFLGTDPAAATDAVNAEPLPGEAVSPAGKKPPINWTAIRYSGYIINPLNREPVSIIIVDGREQMFSEGETISGLKLVRNYGDSVKVLYRDHSKFITLN